MSIRICDVCGKPIPDDANFCTSCGAQQQETIRLTKIPETIEQLQEFCAAHHMPLEKMRFFIGKDYRGARAFGIYRDENGECVVYKNKSDGSRAVRYRGPDEKHAVRELYEKLKSEIELRRGTSSRSASESESPRDGEAEASDGPVKWWEALLGGIFLFWKPIVIVLAAVVLIRVAAHNPSRGYYRYEGNTYYYQSGWYLYDALGSDWAYSSYVPEELEQNYESFYDGKDYDDTDVGRFGVTDFAGSGHYESDWEQFWSSDSDSGSIFDDFDWDSGDDDWDSWDSFDTDWDSDW